MIIGTNNQCFFFNLQKSRNFAASKKKNTDHQILG